MQVYTLPIRQIGLGSRLWSSVITSRAFSVPSFHFKAARTVQTPEGATSRDTALSEHPALGHKYTISKDFDIAKDTASPGDPESVRQRRNALRRNRFATDPVFRNREHLRKTTWEAKQRADPELHAKWKERKLQIHHTRHQTEPYYAIRHAMRSWLYDSNHTRDRLSWKTHVPVMTAEKIERHCASCHAKRRGGFRLWWQRRRSLEDGEDLYDCSTCFLSDPETALPQGFEDVKTVQQLYLRKEQLLEIKPRRRKNALPPPST